MEEGSIKIEVPVLLIAFNRPDTTSQVFGRIRAAIPQKLYVAVDGPRQRKEGDTILIEEVKSIIQKVDWPCETHYKFNKENLGAEITVSSAITWVFEKEESVIILEDDIIAPLSFFKFAEEMLIRYKDDERIATVTGSNFTPIPVPDNADYFFAKYGHSWGWATWKRTWDGFNLNVIVPDKHLDIKYLTTLTNSKKEAKFYQNKFAQINKKGVGKSTWDLIGLYRHRINNSLSIIPKVNLTSNIGIIGLHARGQTEHHFRSFDEKFKVKKHPEKVECFVEYDRHHFETYIYNKKPWFIRIINKTLRVLKIKKRLGL